MVTAAAVTAVAAVVVAALVVALVVVELVVDNSLHMPMTVAADMDSADVEFLVHIVRCCNSDARLAIMNENMFILTVVINYC